MARISQNLQLVNCPKSTLESPHFRPWLLLQDDIWWFEDLGGRLNMIWTLERSVVSKMSKFNLTFNGIIQTDLNLAFKSEIYFWSLTKNMQLHSFLLINKQTIFRWNLMSPKAHLKLSEIFQLFGRIFSVIYLDDFQCQVIHKEMSETSYLISSYPIKCILWLNSFVSKKCHLRCIVHMKAQNPLISLFCFAQLSLKVP